MFDTLELSTRTALVLWGAFLVSALFGAAARGGRFCTMGAISDAYGIGDWTRLRQWAFAAGVAILGFAGLVQGGWVDPADTVYASDRLYLASTLLGGVLFGFGMVLASGCGSRTLLRIGSGSLKALVVFLVMALAAFATIKGITAVVRVATVDRVVWSVASGTALSDGLAQAVGWPAAHARLLLSFLLGGGLIAWALVDRAFRTPIHVSTSLAVGLSIVGMWFVTGHVGHVLEHPQTLEEVYLATNTGRIEAMTFTGPMAYALDWLIYFSDRGKLLTVGVVSVWGVVVGAWVHALLTRSFRWEGFRTTEDLANHLVGGVLMGVGGVTALGCTIGQGLSGLSTLSANSVLALIGIFAGAIAGLRYQTWRLERMA